MRFPGLHLTRRPAANRNGIPDRQDRTSLPEVQGFKNLQTDKSHKFTDRTLEPPVWTDEQKTTFIQIPLFPEQTQQLQELQRLQEMQKHQLPAHTSVLNSDISHSIPDKKMPVPTFSNDKAFPDAENTPADAGL